MEFQPFGKIPRLNRDVILTEKLDGTNAVVAISDDGETVFAGSRNRWVTPEKDNYGFAKWVKEHEDELRMLGPGYHYGEWYGKGIQRGYGLEDKRFALFNTHRWSDEKERPACCEVVTKLYTGPLCTNVVRSHIMMLRTLGSLHVPGYDKPEGLVLFHTATNHIYKVLVENDEGHKG